MPAASRRRRGWSPLTWEGRGHALLPIGAFLRRVAFNLLLGFGLVGASLVLGMWGYSHYEGMDATQSFLNASMILSGMGPVDELHTHGGKLFAGWYAIYSGVALLAIAGLVFAPLLHRLLHHFHADEKDLNPDDDKDAKKR